MLIGATSERTNSEFQIPDAIDELDLALQRQPDGQGPAVGRAQLDAVGVDADHAVLRRDRVSFLGEKELTEA